MNSLPDLGSIIVTVGHDVAGNRTVRTRSTRGPMVSRLLLGRRADETVPAMIRLLYTLCPVAQSVAFRAAAAFAAGDSPEPAKLASWAASVQLEAMTEHLRCLAFELPETLDMESQGDTTAIGKLRARVSQLTEPNEDEARSVLRETSNAALDLLFGDGAVPTLSTWKRPLEVESWVSTRQTIVRPVFSYLCSLPQSLGTSGVAALNASLPSVRSDLAARMTEKGFCTTPVLTTGPAQTSAYMRRATCPAILPCALRNGAGTMIYFYARLLELGTWMQGFEAPGRLVSGFSPEPGVGIGVVETARGTLLHRVRLEEGVIRESTIVAPTEWNFAPGGAAEQALSAINISDPGSWRNRAELVIRQFDACVPFRFEEGGITNA